MRGCSLRSKGNGLRGLVVVERDRSAVVNLDRGYYILRTTGL